ncbi:MAG: peptide-methionine (S)-S-oxide reductase MsrA [Geminicoccaceae bacterium]
MRHQTAKPWLADRLRLAAIMLVTGMAIVGGGIVLAGPQPEEARVLPAPQVDEPAGTAVAETAVVAGGCFWGVQGVFQHVAGVTNAVSGYTGGEAATAHYEMTGTGQTGHAESVQITYDPSKISYGRILQIFFSVAHDPTQSNRQGPDVGTQYRSAIFPMNAEQAKIAAAYVAQLDQSGAFPAKIATSIEPDRTFYPAEDYHQDFLALNPNYPYIVYNDLPKVENLKRLFLDSYRDQPVLVSAQNLSN